MRFRGRTSDSERDAPRARRTGSRSPPCRRPPTQWGVVYQLVHDGAPGTVVVVTLDEQARALRSSEVAAADLPRVVADLERDRPRWVWDDTGHHYPALLAAGVRVERAHDLRLCH